MEKSCSSVLKEFSKIVKMNSFLEVPVFIPSTTERVLTTSLDLDSY